jgi:hypothetical protein
MNRPRILESHPFVLDQVRFAHTAFVTDLFSRRLHRLTNPDALRANLATSTGLTGGPPVPVGVIGIIPPLSSRHTGRPHKPYDNPGDRCVRTTVLTEARNLYATWARSSVRSEAHRPMACYR